MLSPEQDLGSHKDDHGCKRSGQAWNAANWRYVDESRDQQKRAIASVAKRLDNPGEADLFLTPCDILDAIENVVDALDLIHHGSSND